jgi:hypothetical protein
MPFSPYVTSYYCGMSGHYVQRDDAVPNRSGQLLCPLHGKRLRLKPCPKTFGYRLRHKNNQRDALK